MYNWNSSSNVESILSKYGNWIMFASGGIAALILFFIMQPFFEEITSQSPILINLMFAPAFTIGFLYGYKISQKSLKPSETRSPIKRKIMKIFILLFVIGGLFSSVSFALHGGSMFGVPTFDEGPIEYATELISMNGGATFLIVSSIMIMAFATRRIVGFYNGMVSKLVSFVATFTFFSMIAMSLTQTDPTSSQVYLYTFYHAGILSGVMYMMNKFTSNLNKWEDFTNGY